MAGRDLFSRWHAVLRARRHPAADFSRLLHGRGVTLYAHTGETAMRLHQEAILCRLREAIFVLDGLMEHDTELDPRTVYTDTHGSCSEARHWHRASPACTSSHCPRSTARATTRTWIRSWTARSSLT